MARRRSKTFESYLFGVAGAAAIGIAAYFARVAVIEYVANQQIKQMQATIQHIQDDQQRRLESVRQAQLQQAKDKQLAMAREAEEMRARAVQERAKDAAWNRFYHDPSGCDNWQTDAQMVKCLTYKTKVKNEFDIKWALGELSGANG